MDEKYCYKCGNGAAIFSGVCPECGRTPITAAIDIKVAEESVKVSEGYSLSNIPDTYKGVLWSADRLRRGHKDLLGKDFGIEGGSNNFNFQRFVTSLSSLHKAFEEGRLPRSSSIIIAPPKFSKNTFVYSCMQLAINSGFSVAPYLNTVELKRLMTLASENTSYKLYNSLSYDEYVTKDVCFVTVTKLPQRFRAFEVIQEIIDCRSRKNLSTFVVSRFPLSELSKYDHYANSFEASTSNGIDFFKYPGIIEFGV